MEQSYSYKNLDVYQLAKQLVKHIYEVLDTFPAVERYALSDQIRRSVVSVPSNIAEGMSRYSNKEKVHFLEIAYGSLMETECQIDIALEVNYITEAQCQALDEEILSVAKMISSLRTSLLNKEK